VAIAAGALLIGVAAWAAGYGRAASWIWGIGTAPVAAGLLLSIIRDVLAGRVGVDAIALVSMSAALLLGETLAGVVVAIMYAGGNVLEDFAVGRAERELRTLVDRAPRLAHRLREGLVEDVPIEKVAIGEAILVRAGEIVPIDGVVTGGGAVLDEAALTGEPIPVNRRKGEAAWLQPSARPIRFTPHPHTPSAATSPPRRPASSSLAPADHRSASDFP
jgi:cation transport ATPase